MNNARRLTKTELLYINKRVDEIDALFEQDLDEDIQANLASELEGHIATLEQSCRLARIHESCFKLIRGGK